MEPLNRPYRNRQEANGESLIPVDRQPDDLRARIAAVQAQHHHWDYAGALTCACGETFGLGVEAGWEAAVAGWAVHVADAVIRELEPIPERRHVDDQGRVWEWCGGQPGTWAWRITTIDPVEVECDAIDCSGGRAARHWTPRRLPRRPLRQMLALTSNPTFAARTLRAGARSINPAMQMSCWRSPMLPT